MKRTFFAGAIFLSSILFSPAGVLAVPLNAPPQVLEKAAGLYPDLSGPFELRYRSDLRMHEQGFEIITYTLLAGDSEAGYVTRVTSLQSPDSEGYYDLLLRFDAKKRIVASANLVQARDATKGPSKEEPQAAREPGVEPFLQYLQGKDAREYRDALVVLINGLAGGANLRDVEPLPPPPKDYVLDTTGKIMLPGAPMPPVETRDLQGNPFVTKNMKGKVIMVFTAPTCRTCDEMIRALEKGLDLSQKREMVHLVYVVGAETAEAGPYLAGLKVRGIGIAEPDDAVSKAFKAPFRPYLLMFEEGTMKFNFVWENDESKLYGLLYLLIEGNEPEGEDA